MKQKTVRLILDCMICDAMSPEFKKANDILLRIIKTNDRTGGIEYTRLAEINKAFKANDPKAAKAAFDKLASNIAKGEKRLQDELNEAKSKLAETSRAFEEAKSALAQQKLLAAMFDKFVKAIDAAKTNPKGVPKLNAYADKLKAFGDFSKRIMQIQQMATAKKDIAKQCDMLKKAVEAGKAKHAKAMKKAEDDLAKAKDRVSVFKEMDKIRTKKFAEFAKEREDVQKLGAALPSAIEINKENSGNPVSDKKKKAIEYVNSDIKKIFSESKKAFLSFVKKLKEKKSKLLEERNKARQEAMGLLNSISTLQVYDPNLRSDGNWLLNQIKLPVVELIGVNEGAVSRLDGYIKEFQQSAITRGEKSGSKSVVDLAKKMEWSSLIDTLNNMWRSVEDIGSVKLLYDTPFNSFVDATLTEQGNALWKSIFDKIADAASKVKAMIPNFSFGKLSIGPKDVENPASFLSKLRKRIRESKIG